jgi:hypothetical protein
VSFAYILASLWQLDSNQQLISCEHTALTIRPVMTKLSAVGYYLATNKILPSAIYRGLIGILFYHMLGALFGVLFQ